MSESLGELLRRSADAVPDPHLEVGEMVAEAGRRQRRRDAAVAGTAALIVAVVIGSVAVRGGEPRHTEPAPAPAPFPGVIHPEPALRPLVYAAGRTVHVGDDTVKAGAEVQFVEATDGGVLFVTADSDGTWYRDTLWLDDGSTTEAIGRVPTEHIGMFEVYAADPGSLVVWADATSRRHGGTHRFVVYDTARHDVVARIPFRGVYNVVLHVDQDHVYINPDSGSAGCWVYDIHYCAHPHLLRYDVATGRTRTITRAAFEAVLRRAPRTIELAEARGDTGTSYTAGGMARFNQVGRRLVPVDSNGDRSVFRLPTGETLRLRVPAGYRAPGVEMSVVQWLDDDRLVLFPNQGGGDLPEKVGDLLVCRVPDGRCRVVVRSSSTPYIAPG